MAPNARTTKLSIALAVPAASSSNTGTVTVACAHGLSSGSCAICKPGTEQPAPSAARRADEAPGSGLPPLPSSARVKRERPELSPSTARGQLLGADLVEGPKRPKLEDGVDPERPPDFSGGENGERSRGADPPDGALSIHVALPSSSPPVPAAVPATHRIGDRDHAAANPRRTYPFPPSTSCSPCDLAAPSVPPSSSAGPAPAPARPPPAMSLGPPIAPEELARELLSLSERSPGEPLRRGSGAGGAPGEPAAAAAAADVVEAAVVAGALAGASERTEASVREAIRDGSVSEWPRAALRLVRALQGQVSAYRTEVEVLRLVPPPPPLRRTPVELSRGVPRREGREAAETENATLWRQLQKNEGLTRMDGMAGRARAAETERASLRIDLHSAEERAREAERAAAEASERGEELAAALQEREAELSRLSARYALLAPASRAARALSRAAAGDAEALRRLDAPELAEAETRVDALRRSVRVLREAREVLAVVAAERARRDGAAYSSSGAPAFGHFPCGLSVSVTPAGFAPPGPVSPLSPAPSASASASASAAPSPRLPSSSWARPPPPPPPPPPPAELPATPRSPPPSSHALPANLSSPPAPRADDVGSPAPGNGVGLHL
eukprot:tig00000475_g1253.t1